MCIRDRVWVEYNSTTDFVDLELSGIDMPALHFLKGLENALLQFNDSAKYEGGWEFALKLEHPGPTDYCRVLYLKVARIVQLQPQGLLTSWRVGSWNSERNVLR